MVFPLFAPLISGITTLLGGAGTAAAGTAAGATAGAGLGSVAAPLATGTALATPVATGTALAAPVATGTATGAGLGSVAAPLATGTAMAAPVAAKTATGLGALGSKLAANPMATAMIGLGAYDMLSNMGGGGGGGGDGKEPDVDESAEYRTIDMPGSDYTSTAEYKYFPDYNNGGPVRYFNEGGPAGIDQQMQEAIVAGAVAAIRQQSQNPEMAIEQFISVYGPEAFEQLIAEVAARDMGGASEGVVKGAGDGMSDSIPASIDGVAPARIATDEHIIPADVVSALGNGSSDAGHQQLLAMTERVRQGRTGTAEQPPAIDPNQFMPG